jgi:hypothetical protein
MAEPGLREIERGPAFEVYQGPMCALRLDWTRGGAVRAIMVGYASAEMGGIINKRRDAIVRSKVQLTMLYDMWETIGYDSALRLELTKWGQAHKGEEEMVHILSRSKLVNMGVSVVALAVPERVKGYSKRTEFDVLAKNFGLPLNPPMPAAGAAPVI